MAQPSSLPLFEAFEPEWHCFGRLLLRQAPGTKSGYMGVKKIKKNYFQARRAVGGKAQSIWTSSSARECAYILAALDARELDLSSLAEIKELEHRHRRAGGRLQVLE